MLDNLWGNQARFLAISENLLSEVFKITQQVVCGVGVFK